MSRLADPVSTKRPGVRSRSSSTTSLDRDQQIAHALHLVQNQRWGPRHYRFGIRLRLGAQVEIVEAQVGPPRQPRQRANQSGPSKPTLSTRWIHPRRRNADTRRVKSELPPFAARLREATCSIRKRGLGKFQFVPSTHRRSPLFRDSPCRSTRLNELFRRMSRMSVE